MKLKVRKILIKTGYYSKPSFMIIGAQKAGTSALFSILSQHSLLKFSRTKEIHYFDEDDWYTRDNIDQYHACFPLPHKVKAGSLLFEATPSYLYHPLVPERLFNYNPNLKLIIMLREPAARALSAWTMYHYRFKTGKLKFLHDPRPFNEAIDGELDQIDTTDYYRNNIGYINRGKYSDQIEKFLKYFPKDQIHFIESTELKENFKNTIKSVLEFINVPNEELRLSLLNKSMVNEMEKYSKTLIKLKKFYQIHNERLFKLIGRNFDWDSV